MTASYGERFRQHDSQPKKPQRSSVPSRGKSEKKASKNNAPSNRNNKKAQPAAKKRSAEKQQTKKTETAKKFRPYFVPIKKKQELLRPMSTVPLTTNTNNDNNNDTSTRHAPAQILRDGMKNISVASFLREGIPVLMVSRKNHKLGKCRKRYLTLSKDQMSLLVTHSKLTKSSNQLPKQPRWRRAVKGRKNRQGNRKNHYSGSKLDVADICYWQVGVISSRLLEISMAATPRTSKKKDSSKKKNNYPPSTRNIKNSFSGGSKKSGADDPDRVASAVTIFHIDSFTGKMVTLDFFIRNPDHRRAVLATLALMKNTFSEAQQLIGNDIMAGRYVIQNLMDFDEESMSMNETEFLTLCNRLNFTADDIDKEFQKFYEERILKEDGINNNKREESKMKNRLYYDECMQLLQSLKGTRKPAFDAWRACFGTAKSVDASTLLSKFLHGPQQESKSSDLQDAHDLIRVMNVTELAGHEGETTVKNFANKKLTVWQFEEFLNSEWNDIYDPKKRSMETISNRNNKNLWTSQPLSHYWINSSGNTQSTIKKDCDGSSSEGAPSVEYYFRALSRGCKSIDLSCCDGTTLPDGSCVPMIYDGKAESFDSVDSNKITFQSVVLVVRKYIRDKPSTLPIMLNLDNRCSPPFQASMANILKTIFGKHLYIPSSTARKKILPSPKNLQGMIVVNAKQLTPSNINKIPSQSSLSSQRDVSNTNRESYCVMFNKFNLQRPDSARLETFLPSNMDQNELTAITLFHHVEFDGFFINSMDLICSHMHNIEEQEVQKIANRYEDDSKLWRKFNETHLTRIHPNIANDRQQVSDPATNYSPILAWSMGCQQASLQILKHDTNLAINDGFYRQAGGVGYLRKSPWLFGGGKTQQIKLRIRVLSGNCIPKSLRDDKDSQKVFAVDNPCVVLELQDIRLRKNHGESFKITRHKVQCTNRNGYCPIFDDKGKKFSVQTPDLATLVFRVEQDKEHGKILATTAVPVNCLRRGYRSVQLYDEENTRQGRFSSATLLVFVL